MDNNTEVVYLYLDDIIPNRFQPREVFDEQALKELAVSIKEHGVIQPIIVRKVDNKYEIIAGERRYKASTMAGLNKIPAIVKNYDDKESSKVALIENLQRRDLTPIEEARTYQKILELEDDMTQEELAATMGKTQSSVSNKLRLLALPDEIQDALLNEKISERHARCLLNVENANDQVKLLNKVIDEKLTVRELDKIVKEMKEGPSDGSSGGATLEGPETAKEEEPSPKPSISVGPVIQGFPVVENHEEQKEEVKEDPVPAVPAATEVLESEPAPVEPATFKVTGFTPAQSALEPKVEEPVPETSAPVPEVAPVEPVAETVPQATAEEEKKEEVTEEAPVKEAPKFNFDFSKLSNPFMKKSEVPEPAPADNNVASVIEETPVVSAPAPVEKDYGLVKTDIDSLINTLKAKGFTCNYVESDSDNKIEYTITIEK